MPTYEYRCKDCDHEFEAVQSFSDEALTECPQCQGALRKVFGNVGITFKGSGFYKTDSRGGSGAGGSSTGGSSGSDSKAETKTATKTEPKSDTSTSGTPSKPEAKSA